MNMVILFNKPIWLAVTKRDNIRKIVEIYGFKLDADINFDLEDLEYYIDYLCALSKWMQDGNYVKNNTFIEFPTKNIYNYEDEEIQDYRLARLNRNLTFAVYTTDKILDNNTPGIFDGIFIRSRKLYDSIKEYAASVDVRRLISKRDTL